MRRGALLFCAAAGLAQPSAACAQTVAVATAAASPSPSPSTPPDPCGSILSIVTRPTVTTSGCTVRDGHALLETGYTNAVFTGAGGGNTVTYPQAFARFGSAHNVEYNLMLPSANRSSVGGTIATGASDIDAGVKWELGYTAAAEWGANLQVSAPAGTSSFTAGGMGYTANANWSYTLNAIFALSGTLGLNSLAGTNADGSAQRYFTFIPTLLLTAGLPARSQLFAEYAWYSEAGPSLGPKGLIDAGVQHDFGPALQFDAEYGFQPNTVLGQRMHYVGAGLSFMK